MFLYQPGREMDSRCEYRPYHVQTMKIRDLKLSVHHTKTLLWFMSKSVLPMFSSRNFMISNLTFKSLIHFYFIFVYGVRKCFNFILLHVAVSTIWARTILFWLPLLCSIVWSQGAWFLQLCSSFSRLFCLFRIFHVSILTLKLFFLVLWKMPLVFW